MTIIIDEEDVRRIEATTRWGGDAMKISGSGDDLEIIRANGKNVGIAYGFDAHNKKLKEILTSDDEVQVLVWNKINKNFIPVKVHPENGVLDLRQFIQDQE